jgi:signal transduction histidine kinase
MNNTLRYSLLGGAFGICFPVIATAMECYLQQTTPMLAQAQNPLLWIIDTAPIFLGLVSGAGGWRQDRVERALREIEEVNERLLTKNAELIEARNLKSQFVANVSHELRTPLNAVIGFSKILIRKTDGQIADRQRRNLEHIHESGKQLLELVNDLLDIERLEAGVLRTTIHEFDLGELCKTLVETLTPQASAKGIGLVADLPDQLPMLPSDEGRVRQIITNLVVNAIKYSESGTVSLTVSVERRAVRISVADQGMGIAPEELPHIFEAFRQIDGSTTRAAGGVGLGLYLVKQMCDMLGAEISASSTLGEGSTFVVEFPLGLGPSDSGGFTVDSGAHARI